MKRYSEMINSHCIQCDSWLCVMTGTYTGEITCPKCGMGNVFRDSSEPVEGRIGVVENTGENAA
jgi:uncharacterized Zn finger protein (UPF0148 family)